MEIKWLLIDIELSQMNEYLDLIEKSFQERTIHLEEEYRNAMAQEMDEWSLRSMEDYFSDQHFNVIWAFNQLLLLSFITAWYALVEQKLIEICRYYEITIPIDIDDDFNFQSGIRRAKRFLHESGKYTFRDKDWEELVTIGKLRNMIVHSGKSIDVSLDKKKKAPTRILERGREVYLLEIDGNLYRYLDKHTLILEKGMILELLPTFEYCRYLVEFAREIFRDVFGKISHKEE